MVLTLANIAVGDEQTLAVVANSFTALQGENRSRYSLLLEADFVAGNGDGLTVDAWVQSSADGGSTWFDIAEFSFTTADAKRAFNLTTAPVTSIATPTDGSLGSNSAVNGLLGDALRVKWSSTGTYTGGAMLTITAVPR